MDSALNGAVSLLAPLVFVRMTDKLEEVREAAGEAFRNMVPLLALEVCFIYYKRNKISNVRITVSFRMSALQCQD